ncbi:hypothetical protein [Actinomadura sp. WAC 06369]|uniref:hypothetical protein n=1 Tax=Actinomadura sp. WAC 06369 TaxID=2203193 RepID=UPI000F76F0E4|nr:hypothetical protein [Actinomadura sp. WAC 06369]RSN59572.1 hypothetical protein DMH08_22650 [Actinomadura sp. WAC 06369]
MSEATRAHSGADREGHSAALALAKEVQARDLEVVAVRPGSVRVRNPAGEPDKDDPQGQAFSPGLRQEVVCRDRGGVLWWWWVWSGPTRDSCAELEPLCPVADVATAADRLARVLAVREAPNAGV